VLRRCISRAVAYARARTLRIAPTCALIGLAPPAPSPPDDP
jgi:hypothetical protein